MRLLVLSDLHLEFRGYRVIRVMNLTDVDDKTIRGCRAAGLPLAEAVRGLFRGRDFFGRLEGRPEDLRQIRATLESDAFFG